MSFVQIPLILSHSGSLTATFQARIICVIKSRGGTPGDAVSDPGANFVTFLGSPEGCPPLQFWQAPLPPPLPAPPLEGGSSDPVELLFEHRSIPVPRLDQKYWTRWLATRVSILKAHRYLAQVLVPCCDFMSLFHVSLLLAPERPHFWALTQGPTERAPRKEAMKKGSPTEEGPHVWLS